MCPDEYHILVWTILKFPVPILPLCKSETNSLNMVNGIEKYKFHSHKAII